MRSAVPEWAASQERARAVIPRGGALLMPYAAFETLRATLDELSVAVVIVAACGELIFSNNAAKAMLETGWPIRLADGCLQAKDRTVNAALKKAFEFVLSDEHCADPSRYEVCLARPSDGRQGTIAHLRLLTLPGSEPNIALFIIQPDGANHYCAGGFAEAFGLSKAETRTLNALIETGNVAEAAARLSLAVSTVKSHLRKIFQKTNTFRQSDLVRLVASTRTPIRKAVTGKP